MQTDRKYNFGAGPAMLPESVLKKAQEELLNWQNLGTSILEIGHRTAAFSELLKQAEQSLRELLSVPEHYQVLFLGGAARTQFAMIPMNFLHPAEQGGYIITGIWSQMAFMEAELLKKAYIVASKEKIGFKTVPEQTELDIKKNTDYIYYTPNETINGVRFPYVPDTKGITLIADMTSCLLSEPIDVNQYDFIFAGAQKNIANSGLTVVIVKDDLLDKIPQPAIPTMLNYKIQAQHKSLYATPPVFNIYLAALVFDWIKDQGGVKALYQQNCQKAAKLYQYIDQSDFYTTPVAPEARSLVNVCFSTKNPELEKKFLLQANEANLLALEGHRMVGGMRASLYNAMPMAGVEALIHFMTEFKKDNQQ